MLPSNPTVSVIVPTYNSAQRIHIPLEKLILQTADDKSFEIIIIDNASTDDTAEIATNYWKSHGLQNRNIDFRVVREEKKGATHARIRGVLEARGSIVCFLDDDNIPENNYIESGISEFSNESVGLLVSRVFPNYQVEISPSMQKREHLLAINEKLGELRIVWEPTPSLCPSISAGMWVRKEVFLSAIPWRNPETLLTDRIGNSLTCGGDIEFGYFIGSAGFSRVYAPNLRLKHFIPATRLNTRYFCRLINGIVRSTLTLDLKYNHQKYRFTNRLAAMFELLAVVLVSPIILVKRDGIREFLFVISARWARVQGPYLSK